MEDYLKSKINDLEFFWIITGILAMVATCVLIGTLWTNEAAYWKGKYEVLDAIRVDYMPAPMGEALPEGIHAD